MTSKKVSRAAAALGRLGGLSRSPKKAEASRRNGLKGGNPAKFKKEQTT